MGRSAVAELKGLVLIETDELASERRDMSGLEQDETKEWTGGRL